MTVNWRDGPIDFSEHLTRSKFLCPSGHTACPTSLTPIQSVGNALRPEGGHECINLMENLENCGGCTNITGDGQQGVDCSAIRGTNAVRLSLPRHFWRKD